MPKLSFSGPPGPSTSGDTRHRSKRWTKQALPAAASRLELPCFIHQEHLFPRGISRGCSIARHASPSRREEKSSKERGRAVAHLRPTLLGSLPRLRFPTAGTSSFCEGASGRGRPELCQCGMAVWHDICCETPFGGNASQAFAPLRHQKQVALDCR